MIPTTLATGARTESGSLAVPAMLLAGAGRDANAPILQVIFHLAAIACAGPFLGFDLSARASDPGSGLRGLRSGADAYLIKQSLVATDLVETVRRLTGS